MFILGIPLTLSMRELIVSKNVRHQIEDFILEKRESFRDADISSITVTPRKGYVRVDLEIAAPLGSISQEQIEQARSNLSKYVERDIYLDVEVLPVRRLTAPNQSNR